MSDSSEPGLAHPLARPRAASRGPGRAERHHARALRNFAEVPRHSGNVYRASGWIRIGTTRGRGRYDRDKKADEPKKEYLTLPAPEGLEADAQPMKPDPHRRPNWIGLV